MSDTLERRFYRPQEFAHVVGLSRAQIFKMIKEGDLRKVKVGRATLIPVSEIDRIDPPE